MEPVPLRHCESWLYALRLINELRKGKMMFATLLRVIVTMAALSCVLRIFALLNFDENTFFSRINKCLLLEILRILD